MKSRWAWETGLMAILPQASPPDIAPLDGEEDDDLFAGLEDASMSHWRCGPW
jgi:hypothetical protein